jgi:transposase
MIYAGVDIAKVDHVIAAVDERGEGLGKAMGLKNSSAGFERAIGWLEGVAEEPKDVVVGMEATGHYRMACYAHLVSHGHSVCVINPMQVRAVRKPKGLSGARNDRMDARLIAETLRIGQFDQTKLAADDVQSLRALSRYLQSLKGELAEARTQRTCLLDAYLPEFDGVFSDMFGKGARAVLSKSPLPFELGRRRQGPLARDIKEASRRSEETAKKRADELKGRAKASVGIALGQEAASFQVKSLVRQMDFLDGECAKVEALVRGPLEKVEPLVLTIPGISYTTGAQIVSEIGDVSRFRNAAALVSYAGLDSSVNQSGKFDSGGGPITKHGSPYLRRAVWLAAGRACQHDPKLRAFYEKRRAEGKPHRVAVTAVARKLCHVVFAVMRDQAPYDPDR